MATWNRRHFLHKSIGLGVAGCVGQSQNLASPQAAGGQNSPRVEGARVKAIDIHIHAVSPGLPGEKPMPEELRQIMEAAPEVLARHLRAEMERAEVAIAFGMGRWNGDKNDPLGIEGTLRLAALVPGLRAIGIADPTRTDADHIGAVERQIERERQGGKLVALKAYLGYLHFGPEHPNYVPYYKLAARHGLPVIFHTGDTWSTKAKVKYAHPLRVDEVAVDHPDVKFVMAHLGNPWLIDAAEVVFKNDNVWADLSGLFVGDTNAINDLRKKANDLPDAAEGLMFSDLKKALSYTGRPDRFLYGSDWPLAPMPAYRRLIETIVPKDQHGAVFRANAERLFGLLK
jgi:predicted TIM-barrel fold metal-dependent hydrolase